MEEIIFTILKESLIVGILCVILYYMAKHIKTLDERYHSLFKRMEKVLIEQTRFLQIVSDKLQDLEKAIEELKEKVK